MNRNKGSRNRGHGWEIDKGRLNEGSGRWVATGN